MAADLCAAHVVQVPRDAQVLLQHCACLPATTLLMARMECCCCCMLCAACCCCMLPQPCPSSLLSVARMRVEGLLPLGVTQGCCSSWLALERSRGSICSSMTQHVGVWGESQHTTVTLQPTTAGSCAQTVVAVRGKAHHDCPACMSVMFIQLQGISTVTAMTRTVPGCVWTVLAACLALPGEAVTHLEALAQEVIGRRRQPWWPRRAPADTPTAHTA
jgi:hypothetical protein